MTTNRRYSDATDSGSSVQHATRGGWLDPESVRRAAIWYASRGYLPFPVNANSKMPYFRKGAHSLWAPAPNKPAGLTRATADVDAIREHWPLLRGVAIGLVPPEGIAIFDADEKHRRGIVRLLLEQYPVLAAGGHHKTRSDGGHFPGRVPAGVELPQSVDPELGIDTRLGLKGYVVAPPCQGYSVVRSFRHVDDLPEIPAALIALLRPAAPEMAPTAPRALSLGMGRLQRYVWAAVQGEHDTVAAAAEGARNTTLHRSAVKLGSLVGAGALGENDARDALLAGARTCGLAGWEARGTIDSGLRYGITRPRQLEVDA